MCFGSGNNNSQAAANQQTAMLEAQQKKHDDDVSAGKTAIDGAFAQFDQPYYDAYGKAYKDAYNPQLDDQYGIAKDKMMALLAGNDQLGGSVGNDRTAQLNKTYANSQVDISNKASDAENGLKGAVNTSKNNLYSMNASAADPYSAATQAQAATGALVSPASYPTLSNVFGDALGSIATTAKTNSTGSNPLSLSQWFAPTSGAGSSVNA